MAVTVVESSLQNQHYDIASTMIAKGKGSRTAKHLRLASLSCASLAVLCFVVVSTRTIGNRTRAKLALEIDSKLPVSLNAATNRSRVCHLKYSSDIPDEGKLRFYSRTNQIFYNRMPKCGSEMTMTLLRHISERNRWHYPPEDKRIWTITKHGLKYWVDNENTLLNVVNLTMNHCQPMLFSCHLHYIDFTRVWTSPPPTYINIIRKPLDRLVSLYYYTRFDPVQKKPMPEARRMMTYDECVNKNTPECTSPSPTGYFTLVPYFCGHDPVCRSPSRSALDRAKRNVEESYAVVGLTEDMATFTRVLEIVIPGYFDGMSELYKEMKANNQANVNKNTYHKVTPKKTTLKKMEHFLQLENEFYEFIKRRFYSLVEFLRCKGHSL